MFGVTLTYALLIYQTRDSKADLENLLQTNMFVSKAHHLEALMLQIMSVLGKNATNTDT